LGLRSASLSIATGPEELVNSSVASDPLPLSNADTNPHASGNDAAATITAMQTVSVFRIVPSRITTLHVHLNYTMPFHARSFSRGMFHVEPRNAAGA
jgi:hypothetical protein